MKACRKKSGLTLIEMLIVVALIAVMASMMVAVATRTDNQAKEQLTRNTITILVSALQEYHDSEEQFPQALFGDDPNEILYEALSMVPQSRKILEKVSDSLIDENYGDGNIPEIYDSWGTVLDYNYVSGDNFPVITSSGPDKNYYTDNDNISSK